MARPLPQKVARLAQVLRIGVALLMIAVPLAILLPSLAGWVTPEMVAQDFPAIPLPEAFQTWQVIGLVVVGGLPAAMMLYALWALFRLLTLYRQGDRLTGTCALAIRHVGIGLLATAVLQMLTYPLVVLVLTLENAPGLRTLSIGVTWSDMAFLMAGGVVVLIGWVMGEAAEIAADNRAII